MSSKIDFGLRAYMIRVYNYMAVGVAFTGVTAWLTFNAAVMESAGRLVLTPFGQIIFSGPVVLVLFLATVGVVFLISWRVNTLQPSTVITLFMVYAGLLGLMLSSVFFHYTGASVTRGLFISAAAFGALSLYGYTTQRDLSPIGSFVFVGFIGLIVAMLVNLFVQSTGLDFVISVAVVLIFAGLTARDKKRIEKMYDPTENNYLGARKAALLLYSLVSGSVSPAQSVASVSSSSLSPNSSMKQESTKASPNPPTHDQSPQNSIDQQQTGDASGSAEWFYSHRGTIVGPVSGVHLTDLHLQGKLENDVHVWRKGLKGWLPITEYSELLCAGIDRGLPPLSPQLISNTLVWIVALLPLAFMLIDAAIVQLQMQQLLASGWWNLLEIKEQGGLITTSVKRPEGLPMFIPAVLNSVLCFLDERKLKRAGYSTQHMPALALLLSPVYLFVRAKKLKQVAYYGVVWIALTLIWIFAL